MKKHTSNLFFYSMQHSNQILLQEIMLFIEYLPIIAIAIASPSLIYQYYHYSIYQSTFSQYFFFKIQIVIDVTKHINTKLIIGLMTFLFLSLITYHLIPFLFNCTMKETDWKQKCFNRFCSVYYDLFLMRTANYYIIYFYFLLFNYSLNQSSLKGYYYFIALIFVVLLIWYIIDVYNHITINCVILQLENKKITNQVMNYPYDWCFSMPHDIIMLGLKIICSIEAAYFNSVTLEFIQFLMFSLNLLIVLYITLYVFYLCYNTIIHIRLEWFAFNRLLVFLRIGIVLFIWYSIIFHLLFLNSSSLNALIFSIILMSLLWSIISICFLWKIIIPNSLYNGKIQLIKMVFVLSITSIPSSFKIDHYRLITSFEFKYNIWFKKTSLSSLKPNLFSIQNQLMHIFIIYNILKEKQTKSKKNTHEVINHIYSDIIQLLYYFTKGNTLQYFCYSNNIIKKYSTKQKSITENVHLLVDVLLTKCDNDDELVIFNDLFKGTKLDHIIDKALISMKEVIQSPKEMMKPIIFYRLSHEISKLKLCAKTIVNQINLNDNKNIADVSTRNMIQVNNYCLLIHRYLIETLTNEVLFQDNRLDSDLLKDFLSFHFVQDKTLVLSTPIAKLEMTETIALSNIIKCGNEMIKYKGHPMTMIFPQKFRKEGIRLFSQKLCQYISEDSSNSFISANISTIASEQNAPFQFIMNSVVSSYVDLFVYSFKIIPTIINNEMIINGVYSSNDKIILIFKEELDGELILETFSPSVQNLLIINPEWVEFLNSHSIVITFSELFHKSTMKSQKDGQHEYDCQFSYQIFLKHLLAMQNFEDLILLFKKKNPTIDFKAQLLQAKETKFNVVHLQLFYLFTISERYRYLVYSIVSAKVLKTIRKSLGTNDDFEIENNIFNLYQTTNTMTNSSVSSTTLSTSDILKKRKPFGKYSNTIAETFEKFSYLILLFLSFIIIVCIIFLIIQIIQSQSLYKVNTLYYKFKTLQIFFSHSFLNVFSNICIAEQKSDVCSNAYQDYSRTMQKLFDLPEKFSTRDYVVNAIGFLINNLQGLYNSYNDNIHAYGDQTLIDILLTKMNYIMIRQLDNDLKQEVIQITLEEGLKKFINSLAILNQAKDNFDAPQYSFHIITVKLLNVDFNNVLNKNLNEVQTEIYKICMNYINYSSGFASGESKLIDLYNKREKVKKMILYLYIILVLILHFILAILCRWILIIVQQLLTSIISEIIEELNTKEVKTYLVSKLDILSTLNKLYIENPNSLFKKQAKARKDLIKSFGFLKGKKDNNNPDNRTNDKGYLTHLQTIEKSNLVKQSEMKILLMPVLLKVYGLFILFFSCVIVFNVFLLHSFSDVMLINNYVLSHIGLESQLYDNIALLQIITLVNLTQTNLAAELGIENSSDGILNMKIRHGGKFKDHIFNQERNHPTMFPPTSSFFNYNCHDIFNLVSDNVTISVGQYLSVDYLYYQIKLCEKFKLTSLDNFEYMYNEHNLRSQLLQDYLKTFSYDELYNFNEQFDFFDVFTLTILIIRPLKAYINEKILYKKIDKAFKQFIFVISGYLAFNIIGDILIFLIIKIVVLGKINSIHLNFLNLNKCFSISKSMDTN